MPIVTELIVSIVGGVATALIPGALVRPTEPAPPRHSRAGRFLENLVHLLLAFGGGIAIALLMGRYLIQTGIMTRGRRAAHSGGRRDLAHLVCHIAACGAAERRHVFGWSNGWPAFTPVHNRLSPSSPCFGSHVSASSAMFDCAPAKAMPLSPAWPLIDCDDHEQGTRFVATAMFGSSLIMAPILALTAP